MGGFFLREVSVGMWVVKCTRGGFLVSGGDMLGCLGYNQLISRLIKC